MFQDFISLHNFFFFNDTATTEIYTLSYTTLFRSARIPLLGRAMVTAGHLTIDRAHPARALEAYQRAAEVIRGGTSALLFPEGTRSRTGALLPFKNAPFGLAIAAQVPVVPVYVGHTFEIMPKGRLFLRPRPIRIVIGDPISTAGVKVARRRN